MADREDRRGLKDGNDRVPTIARWLAQKVPSSARVVELVLTAWTAEEDAEVLARYPRADVHDGLAVELSALIQDYADDAGTTCKAQLAWLDESGQPYSSKRFRGLCAANRRVTIEPLDGTMSSLLAGNQRHLEAVLETTMRERMATEAARDRENARYERLFSLLDRQLERAHERIMALEERAEIAEETATEAAEIAEEAAATAEEAIEQTENANKEDEDRFARVIEIATKQLAGG